MRSESRLGAIGATVFALLLSACGGNAEGPSRRTDAAVPVTTEQVRPRPWSDTVRALGTVKARESVTVTAKVSETVANVHFDSGDRVQAGAPLVTLTGQAQQAELNQAQATAAEAEQMFRRQEELASQQLIARSTLDTQRSVRDAARARVAQIRAQLADRVIRAPFAGVLGLRQVSPGALVTPGTAIATLDDLGRVFVDFPVPESLLAAVAEGQSITATSAAYPGREFEGVVRVADPRIDPATRAFTVRGDFPNPDGDLRPGLLLEVTLIQPERPALLVPEIGIVQVGNSSYVFRVGADNQVQRADVEVGSRRGGMAEITGGLEAGDRIVVDGTGKLRPGMTVDPRAGAAVAEGASAQGRPVPENPSANPSADASADAPASGNVAPAVPASDRES
ncbi:MAG: efflux RND transporter periplasmic adaptor subunit, partial [Pseudomonadota bacterium]|nr:efflux RND transporter periplasmic adaptor subunit [Pseudomonadota bacterium]